MRRRKRRRLQNEVELNLAAMLDMAFQLLAFFMLTFKPAPIEGQISLRLPPAQPTTVVKAGQPAGEKNRPDPLSGLDSLVITVLPNPQGGLAGNSVAIGDGPGLGLSELGQRLRGIFASGSEGIPTTFDQIIIQAGTHLRYDALMSVIDVCSHQTLPDGKPLTKLSFVELGSD